jgi:hypothetical protein
MCTLRGAQGGSKNSRIIEFIPNLGMKSAIRCRRAVPLFDAAQFDPVRLRRW